MAMKKNVCMMIMGFLMLFLPCFSSQNLSQHRSIPDMSIPFDNQMIAVDGNTLHCRVFGKGEPVVILMNGMGATQRYWNGIIPDIAKRCTVLSYDRSGYGKSLAGQRPHDVENAALDLDGVLKSLGLRGPFVLVAHSYGAHLARLFAQRRSVDVQGILLLDPMDENATRKVKSLLSGNELSRFEDMMRQVPMMTGVAGEEMKRMEKTAEQLKTCTLPAKIPLTVLAADKKRIDPMFGEEVNLQIAAQKKAFLESLAKQSDQGRLEYVAHVGHNLHLDKPELVVNEIIKMLSLPGDKSAQIEPMSDKERKEVIESVCNLLEKNYVFPEKVAAMKRTIGKYAKGKGSAGENPSEFAQKLTAELQTVSHDLHLRVFFDPESVMQIRNRTNVSETTSKASQERKKKGNFGFKEVRILPGNIGYLNLTSFDDPKFAGDTAVTAMEFLCNVDAFILDLRNNGGGTFWMQQLLASYFFDSKPVHLNDYFWRSSGLRQVWTLPYVPGKRMPNVDLYILIGKGTVSAPEGFAYAMQNLKRATLVGSVTPGAALAGGTQVVGDRFTMWISLGRSISPVTKTDWEETGVIPDVAANDDHALTMAQRLALEKLAATNEAEKGMYLWHLKVLKARLNPVTVDVALQKSYVGSYGPRKISFENGSLYYERTGSGKHRLWALDEDLFMFDANPGFRLKILKEGNQVIGLEGQYASGATDRSMKDKE